MFRWHYLWGAMLLEASPLNLAKIHTNCNDEFVDQAIASFASAACQFCDLVENGNEPNSWVFAKRCLETLLLVFERALLLPDVEPTTTAGFRRVDDDMLRDISYGIGQRLVRDYYWVVPDPFEKDQPSVGAGLLSDDVLDIWRDIKEGLLALDGDMQISVHDVAWHWRFTFETHWHHHAAGAIGALSSLCFGPSADVHRPNRPPLDR